MTSTNIIKIAHIVPSFDVGGLENGIINLINNLDATRYEHEIFVLNGDAQVACRITRDIPIKCLHKKAGNDFKLPFKLSGLLREYKPDIVRTYAWGSWLEGLLAAFFAGVPVRIHSEHGFIINDECTTPLRRRLAQFLASKFTHKIISVSESITEALIKHSYISPSKIITITNGVDSDRFKPDESFKCGLRKKLNIPDDACIAGTVSRLNEVKDLGTAIKAIKGIDNLHLIITGSGPDETHLKEMVLELNLGGFVHFLGERSDINLILKELDIYLLTSLREGTSNTLLEAMSTGLPVVSTRVGGNLLIINEGVNGMFIDVKDVEQLSLILKSYSGKKNEFLRMGNNARQFILEKYSLINMVSLYDGLYKSMVRKH